MTTTQAVATIILGNFAIIGGLKYYAANRETWGNVWRGRKAERKDSLARRVLS